jgi:hypothetical protein
VEHSDVVLDVLGAYVVVHGALEDRVAYIRDAFEGETRDVDDVQLPAVDHNVHMDQLLVVGVYARVLDAQATEHNNDVHIRAKQIAAVLDRFLLFAKIHTLVQQMQLCHTI